MALQRRQTRQNSNIFQMLTKNQLVELREAFNMIDVDADSKLTIFDLTTFLQKIGSPFTDVEIKEMIDELEPNPTYIMLLTIIGERLSEISNEKEIMECFSYFDDKMVENDYFIDNSFFKEWMTEKGDKLTVEEYDYLVRGCVENGRLNYKKLTKKMKHGEIVEN